MHITRLSNVATLCLMAMTGLYGVRPAAADETIIRSTVSQPQVFVSPGQMVIAPAAASTTTTTRTTTISQPPPVDEVIERKTVVFPTSSTGGTSVSSSSTTVDTSALENGKPDYGRRIQNLKSQLDKASANGWISPDRAASLNSEYDSLVSDEETVRRNGYLKVDCDSIEKKLNAFNIELSDEMAKSNHM